MGIEDDDLIEGSPPSAPQGLEVSGTEATTATLKWKEPRKDGGAPIKEYFIEFKSDQDEEWQEGPKIKPKKFLTETVAELTAKMKYQFRVRKYLCSMDHHSDYFWYLVNHREAHFLVKND